MFKKIFIIAFLLLFSVYGYGADAELYNQGEIINLNVRPVSEIANYANVTAFYETASQVTYYFKATFVDSSDQYHSKPMFIADCNDVDGYCRGIVSAASDCNIIYHFSYDDRNTWTTVTPATFDALSNTAVGDTIGINAAANDVAGFHNGMWLVVEFDAGSTALNDDEVVTWVCTLKKDGNYINSSGDYKSIARVANKSNTNP